MRVSNAICSSNNSSVAKRNMREFCVLVACLAMAAAVPTRSQKIIGGAPATVSQYTSVAALLFSWDLSTYWQACGGTILTPRSVLTAAHCVYGDAPNRWRVRVGSSYANSRGTVHNVASTIVHSGYNFTTADNDIAILRLSTNISYVANAVQQAAIPGVNYNLQDNQVVWAIGWGKTSITGSTSEQLQHVQIWTINQTVCAQRYSTVYRTITANMLCSGWLDVGGRDQCQGDSGGPLYHNGVAVGVCSWGQQCALPYYPGVNTRVSKYTPWIQANA